ncbi:catalase [Pseudoalteromonas sp. Hal099]
MFDQQFADEFEFDVFDATKLIPEEQVPSKNCGPHGASTV